MALLHPFPSDPCPPYIGASGPPPCTLLKHSRCLPRLCTCLLLPDARGPQRVADASDRGYHERPARGQQLRPRHGGTVQVRSVTLKACLGGQIVQRRGLSDHSGKSLVIAFSSLPGFASLPVRPPTPSLLPAPSPPHPADVPHRTHCSSTSGAHRHPGSLRWPSAWPGPMRGAAGQRMHWPVTLSGSRGITGARAG